MSGRSFGRALASVVLAAAPGLGASCSTHTRAGPYATLGEGDRLTALSERLTREAADLIRSDPAKAEQLLRDALTADLYHGPAHNNLGVLCLIQGRMYEAANEFEWARKLMPGHPSPRFNLALTFERAGRADDAVAMYDAALEIHPGHIQTVQAIARLQVRSGKCDERTESLLNDIALRGETEQWREWAIEQLKLATWLRSARVTLTRFSRTES